MINESDEPYYSYIMSNMVCTCIDCWNYKLLAEKYFTERLSEIEQHWQNLVHK